MTRPRRAAKLVLLAYMLIFVSWFIYLPKLPKQTQTTDHNTDSIGSEEVYLVEHTLLRY